MEFCIRCNNTASWECECMVILCYEHMEMHLEEEKDHRISKLKPFVISDVQRDSLKSLLSQLKVIDQCSEQIVKTSNVFIQEILKLASKSLKSLQEKRLEILDNLKLTNKRIKGEEIEKLQELSVAILISQTREVTPVQEQLQKYFQIPFFEKQAQLKFPIENYGLVLNCPTSNVISVAISRDNKFIVSCDEENNMQVWNLQEGYQEVLFQCHYSTVGCLAITNDNKFIVFGSPDAVYEAMNRL